MMAITALFSPEMLLEIEAEAVVLEEEVVVVGVPMAEAGSRAGFHHHFRG